MSDNQRLTRAGFTLMELMIAITIIGLLMGVLIPTVRGFKARIDVGLARTMLRTFKDAIASYQMDIHQLPQTLKDLVQKPRDPNAAKKWVVKYLGKEEIPQDPWDSDYVYKLTPGAKHQYELYSRGPKMEEATKEDWISVWDED
jgi:general secretion pathway protein G